MRAAVLFDSDFDLIAIPPDTAGDAPRAPAHHGSSPDPSLGAWQSDEPETIAPAIEAADLLRAREEGWQAGHETGRAEGYAAGRADADATAAAAARRALAAIAAQTEAAVQAGERMAEDSAETLARLMLGMLAAAFPAACARLGEGEAIAFARTLLPGLRLEPVLTLRGPPALLPALEQELRQADPDLCARTRLLADPSLGPSDLAVAWRDGGAVRDAAASWRAARKVLTELDLLTEEPPDVR
jgi:hypothetical protein